MRWLDGALVSSLVPVLLACGLLNPYSAGKLAREAGISPAAIREGRCVDFGVHLEGRGDVSPLVMVTHFGNKCAEAARLDMTRLEVIAWFPAPGASGARPLHLLDPRGEITPLHLEVHTMGTEKILLGPLDWARPSRVCVRVDDAIDGPIDGPIDGQEATPICFVPEPEGGWGVLR